MFLAGQEKGDRNHHEVALAVKTVLRTDWGDQWEPISSFIIIGWLKTGGETILVVGVYAPNEDRDDCVKDDVYDGLQRVPICANFQSEEWSQ